MCTALREHSTKADRVPWRNHRDGNVLQFIEHLSELIRVKISRPSLVVLIPERLN